MSRPDSIVVLSGPANQWLIETTAKRSHAWYLNDLVNRMTTEEQSRMKRGISYSVHPGQVEVSQLSLVQFWHVSRMTVRRLLERMQNLGLIRIHADQLTCVLDILCVLGWNSSGQFIRNPYWQPVEGLDLAISGRSPDAGEDSPSAEPPGFPSQPTIEEILERRQLRIDFDSVSD